AKHISASSSCALDPNTESLATRQVWCRNEQKTCSELCGSTGDTVSSMQNALTYSFTCTDGAGPNISDYQQNRPTQICLQWQTNSLVANPNDLQGQEACLAVICGNKTVSTISSGSPCPNPSTTSAPPLSTTLPSSASSVSTSSTSSMTITTVSATFKQFSPVDILKHLTKCSNLTKFTNTSASFSLTAIDGC
ncbi:hypothetical protein K432DRAFT_459414, partial [Lepidopterella palustris CBS 459.81]